MSNSLASRLSVADPTHVPFTQTPSTLSAPPTCEHHPAAPPRSRGGGSDARYTPGRVGVGHPRRRPGEGHADVRVLRPVPALQRPAAGHRRSRPTRGRRCRRRRRRRRAPRAARPARKRHEPSRLRTHGDAPVRADASSGHGSSGRPHREAPEPDVLGLLQEPRARRTGPARRCSAHDTRGSPNTGAVPASVGLGLARHHPRVRVVEHRPAALAHHAHVGAQYAHA